MPQMETINAIENMNLTLHIPGDSMRPEIARIDRRTMRKGSPVPTLYLE